MPSSIVISRYPTHLMNVYHKHSESRTLVLTLTGIRMVWHKLTSGWPAHDLYFFCNRALLAGDLRLTLLLCNLPIFGKRRCQLLRHALCFNIPFCLFLWGGRLYLHKIERGREYHKNHLRQTGHSLENGNIRYRAHQQVSYVKTVTSRTCLRCEVPATFHHQENPNICRLCLLSTDWLPGYSGLWCWRMPSPGKHR